MNAQINAAIIANINKGMDLPEAFDAVLGLGAYKKMAGEVYNELRTKQGL